MPLSGQYRGIYLLETWMQINAGLGLFMLKELSCFPNSPCSGWEGICNFHQPPSKKYTHAHMLLYFKSIYTSNPLLEKSHLHAQKTNQVVYLFWVRTFMLKYWICPLYGFILFVKGLCRGTHIHRHAESCRKSVRHCHLQRYSCFLQHHTSSVPLTPHCKTATPVKKTKKQTELKEISFESSINQSLWNLNFRRTNRIILTSVTSFNL